MKPATIACRAVVLAAVLAVAALLAAQLMTLLLAVVVTIIVALPLSAAASLAQRHGLPRAAGVLGALLAAAGAAGALAALVLPQFVLQAREFATRLPSVVVAVERWLGLTAATPPSFSREVSDAVRSYVGHPDRLIGPLLQVVGSVGGILVLVALVVLAACTIALDPEPLLGATLRLLPAAHRLRAREVLGRIRIAWLGWLAAVGIDMVVLGGLLFAGMTIVGLPFALGHSPTEGLLVLLVYVLVNQIEGNLILPLIMAKTVDLHPAVVTVGVVGMSALFGVIGVLISIPLLSLAIILVHAFWIEPLETPDARLEVPSQLFVRSDASPPPQSGSRLGG
jgi:predicted PurR-regulated permease PerM